MPGPAAVAERAQGQACHPTAGRPSTWGLRCRRTSCGSCGARSVSRRCARAVTAASRTTTGRRTGCRCAGRQQRHCLAAHLRPSNGLQHRPPPPTTPGPSWPCAVPLPQHVSQEQTYERGAKVTVFHLRLITHWGCETDDNPNLCCSAGIDSMVLDVEPTLMVGAPTCCLRPSPPACLPAFRAAGSLPPPGSMSRGAGGAGGPGQEPAPSAAAAAAAGHARHVQQQEPGRQLQAEHLGAEPDRPQPAPVRRAGLRPQLGRHCGRLADRPVPCALPGAAGGPVLGGADRQRAGRPGRQLLPAGRDAARCGGAVAAAHVLRQRAQASPQHAGAPARGLRLRARAC
jgi:hypothetical protein